MAEEDVEKFGEAASGMTDGVNIGQRSGWRKGVGYAMASTLASVMVYLVGKVPLPHMTTDLFCAFWFGFSFAYHTVLFLLTGQRRFFVVPRTHRTTVLFMGLVETIANLSFFHALKLMEPALTAFFATLNVVVIVVCSALFLGERFGKEETVGMTLAFLGVVLIRYRASPEVSHGLFYILVFSVFFAVDVLLARRAVPYVSPLTLTFYRGLMVGGFSLLSCIMRGSWAIPESNLILALAIGSFFGPFLNMIFYFQALRHMEAAKVSVLRMLQSFFVLIGGYLAFGSLPTPRQIGGGVVLVLGVAFLMFGRSRALSPEDMNVAGGKVP